MGCPTIAPAECDDPSSDWYQYVTSKELIAEPNLHLSGENPSQVGPGFYELYEQDLDLTQRELKNNGLRLGLEWSRLFPTATDGVEGYDNLKKRANPKALAFYHKLLAALKARGMKPLVTVHHYVLPLWIHDGVACHKDIVNCKNRGWVDRARIVKELSKFAGFVGREFGAEVDLWATLNEPFTAVILPGYLFQTPDRTNPPAVFLKTAEAKTAMVAMIEAHARMYDALQAADTVDVDGDGRASRIGVVYNLQATAPDDPDSALDRRGVKNLEYLMNELFLNAVAKGDLDAQLDGKVVHRDDLAKRMDYLGINYYSRAVAQGTAESVFPQISPLLTIDLLNLKLKSDPKGLYEVLLWAKAKYNLPIFVTETGAAPLKPEEEPQREAWVVGTLSWIHQAIADGVPVEGYYYWSLMDNYEWNHGMGLRFGLLAVDPGKAKARTVREAGRTYGQIAAGGEISVALQGRFPR